MAVKKTRTVCLCTGTTETEILQVLKKGAKNLDEVKEFTLASTGCGRCKGEVEALIDQYKKNKTIDLQQNIDF